LTLLTFFALWLWTAVVCVFGFWCGRELTRARLTTTEGGKRMHDDAFYIWSMEHQAWWRPGERGYSERLAGAGRYPRADATRIVQDANIVACHECMIPVAAVNSEPEED